eukprot:CAMPEP_0169417034 /NCGR_PEP_ID=MMETSP1017-20121227/63476_1 /TAXON_ID=342587 /ORGANISM="Karlodinium micrum, Strain CCMP2283" /LENGTH=126 /DNA_ID=CAMNT_0009525093 /DNA_START=31 /DNA_END=407 /DNA_ORIENTATION=-
MRSDAPMKATLEDDGKLHWNDTGNVWTKSEQIWLGPFLHRRAEQPLEYFCNFATETCEFDIQDLLRQERRSIDGRKYTKLELVQAFGQDEAVRKWEAAPQEVRISDFRTLGSKLRLLARMSEQLGA